MKKSLQLTARIKKCLRSILFVLALLLMFGIILLGSVYIVLYDFQFYTVEALRLQTTSQAPEAIAYNTEVMNFVLGKSPSLNVPFTLSERAHLSDVRNLMNLGKIVLCILFGLLVVTSYLLVRSSHSISQNHLATMREIMRILFWGSCLTLVILLLGSLAAFFSFDSVFINFHEIFFTSGTWTFPTSSLLITLYPYEYFQDSLVYILRVTLVISILFLIASSIILFSKVHHH
jgi:integral membrane protein (TIGR01906 family)